MPLDDRKKKILEDLYYKDGLSFGRDALFDIVKKRYKKTPPLLSTSLSLSLSSGWGCVCVCVCVCVWGGGRQSCGSRPGKVPPLDMSRHWRDITMPEETYVPWEKKRDALVWRDSSRTGPRRDVALGDGLFGWPRNSWVAFTAADS